MSCYSYSLYSHGLALEEKNKNDKAVSFLALYLVWIICVQLLHYLTVELKDLSYLAALSTAEDDLGAIFDLIKENAMQSKRAGGLGNDITNIRATDSWIKSTNGKSSGIIPFTRC